jgi:hypothetical protein
VRSFAGQRLRYYDPASERSALEGRETPANPSFSNTQTFSETGTTPTMPRRQSRIRQNLIAH